MLTIDGSQGEGGGQILRTALSLATATGTPFRIEKIRARRSTPGLLRQHLTAVKAATTISSAKVLGAELGSQELTFSPALIKPGEFAFAVGTAGSATLVFQTILPALLTAAGPSSLLLEGGTHNPAAPPFDFIASTFLPLINRLGATVTVELERPGFYPAGGGRFTVSITPTAALGRLDILERREITSIRARAIVANLPKSIADREVNLIGRLLSLPEDSLAAEEAEGAIGPGNVAMVEVEFASHSEVFTGFGEIRLKAESVAAKVVQDVRAYFASGAPVGRHLADQLLVPMALASGGVFRTGPLSRHATTNISVIEQFLPGRIRTIIESNRACRVEISA